MTAAGTSVFVFGIYVAVVIGIPYTFMPNKALSMLKQDETKEVWIRILGLILTILGAYYIVAGLLDDTIFMWMTVFGRAAMFLGFIVFVATRLAKPVLLVFGTIDLLAAVWTFVALRLG